MRKAESGGRSRVGRMVLYVVGVLYLSTWIWGIPAAHTAIVKTVIADYKQALARHPKEVHPAHPRLRFGASYAVLPFVTVNHYEYQVAGLWGWGGFTVDVWCLSRTKTIFGLTKWVS